MAKAKTRAGKGQHPKVKAGTSKESAEQRKALFIEAFIANGGNATQAAIKAGFSAKSAKQQGSRLLTDANLLAAIERRRKELREKVELTTEKVLRNLAQAIMFDPRKMFNADGSLKRMQDLDDDTAQALAGFEVVEMAGGMKIDGEGGVQHIPMYTKKVKWLDKNSAREQAMKHFGLYEQDNDQIGRAMARVIRVPAKQPEHAK